MKKLLVLLAMVLGLLVSGCFPAVGHWVKKPDQTDDEYWNDREACNRYTIDQTLRGSGVRGYKYEYFGIKGSIEKRYFDQCMKDKGYEYK